MRRALGGLVPVITVFLLLGVASSAQAADPATLVLEAPLEANLGGTVTVTAELRDAAGAPIAGATIMLWTPASFLSVGGAMRLGEAATDAQGRVTFHYQPRSGGLVTLNAYFASNSRYAAAQASAEVAVSGSGQLYEQKAGIRVPGIGVWLLVAVLGGVWATYFTVMVMVTLVARQAARARAAGGQRV